MTTADVWLFVFACIGGLASVLTVIQILTAFFPSLLTLRSKLWKGVSDLVKIRHFRRKAIATGIEQVLNQTTFALQKELPRGWVRRAKIKWVRNAQMAAMDEDHLVLRIRPSGDQDWNFFNAVYSYFLGGLFPTTKDILPREQVSAIALGITRSALEKGYSYLLEQFDTKHIRALCNDSQDVLDSYGDCIRLNEFGLLTGPYIRELDFLAKNARFGLHSKDLPMQLRGITSHMLDFQANLSLPEDAWYFKGPCTAYGFILVSRPPETRPDVNAYVKRAQSNLQRGVKRLYVLGRHEEREFVHQVIRSINGIRELKLLELFELSYDYRGEPQGVCALLGLDEVLDKLHLRTRHVNGLPTQVEKQTMVTIEPEMSVHSKDYLSSENDESDNLEDVIDQLIIRLSDYPDEWIHLAGLGEGLRREIPTFSPRNYGARNLLSILERIDSLEFDARGIGPAKAVYVRKKRTRASSANQTSTTATAGSASTLDENLKRLLFATIKEGTEQTGWMFLARLGYVLNQRGHAIDYRQYGASSMYNLLKRIPELEFEERGGEQGAKTVYVRIRQA